MKVKVLTRDTASSVEGGAKGSTTSLLHKNLDPDLHPFAREREYTRALNAVKLDKVFAKPLVGALDAHQESVNGLRRSNVTTVF